MRRPCRSALTSAASGKCSARNRSRNGAKAGRHRLSQPREPRALRRRRHRPVYPRGTPAPQSALGRAARRRPARPQGQPTPADANAHRLRTRDGKARYAKRKATVETVFGIIKQVLGFRQFLLRGLRAVQGEWALVCMGWNLKRLFPLKG
ncbi:transposase [Thiocapsa sp.]|uniref:transposase n=1 Tax=Thiocapsa sp. TaxID=2024551 RepID=UPI00262D424E|nr:transposase [Thiocapsa sp.]